MIQAGWALAHAPFVVFLLVLLAVGLWLIWREERNNKS